MRTNAHDISPKTINSAVIRPRSYETARAAGMRDANDPYRAAASWDEARGHVIAVRFLNRYGASISAHLWSPLPVGGMMTTGPLPTVVLIPGACGPGVCEEFYWWAAEDLAENGYWS